ncbi:MAG: phytoene desaturase family protein [Paludibacteraceae bacterium]
MRSGFMSSVIIIGAGLGGLECGYILAKKGLQVTVLEHDARVGGCLQSFRRGSTLFDAGFHYVGGLVEGQPLHRIFSYLDLLDLPWQRLDTDCFDEVIIGDRHFPFAQGHEAFAERLTDCFPHQRENLRQYTRFLQQVGEHVFDPLQPDYQGNPLFGESAYQWLCSTISDPLLRQVLSGTSLKMELRAESLPLYTFAQINDSFIQSAWRLSGGGQQIAERLRRRIEEMGGQVRTRATVTRLIEHNGRISQAEINGGERLQADLFISNIHPSVTLELINDCPAVRKIYRKRIASLDNTGGMFTANISLKPNRLPYLNRNLFIHREGADLWQNPTDSMLVHFYPNEHALDLLTPMRWEEVSAWADKPRGRRGEDYVAFKAQKTEECLQRAEQYIPDLRQAIDRVYTSTPLSYTHYTFTPRGSAYGIRKDWRSPLTTVLTPRTPLPNLFLTGQNLNLHGVLGVSMTALMTCKAVVSD